MTFRRCWNLFFIRIYNRERHLRPNFLSIFCFSISCLCFHFYRAVEGCIWQRRLKKNVFSLLIDVIQTVQVFNSWIIYFCSRRLEVECIFISTPFHLLYNSVIFYLSKWLNCHWEEVCCGCAKVNVQRSYITRELFIFCYFVIRRDILPISILQQYLKFSSCRLTSSDLTVQRVLSKR